jgi:hypothetical protein
VEVPNGVDVEAFSPGQAPREDIPADATVALFVAALDRAHHFKRLDLTIDALARAADPSLHLLVVGGGELLEDYRAQADRAGVGERVHFAGAQPHGELPRFMRMADFLVLATEPPESFGLVYIEAMASGLPVIGTDIPGVRTVVRDGHNGFLVPRGDVVALASALDRMAQADRAALGAAGRAIVVDSWPDDRLRRELAGDERVTVVEVPVGTRLGAGRQAGLQASTARLVAFLDSDAVPRPGWLDALRAVVSVPSVAVAGGPVLPVWPAGRRAPRLFNTQPAFDFLSMLDLGPERIAVPRVMPGNMAVDRGLTGEDVFDAAFGRAGGDLLGAEETAMMLQVLGRGERIEYVPAAAVDHHTKPERMTWRWMWKRVEAAGREAHLIGQREEPLPRRFGRRDRAFLGFVAPAYFAGRIRARLTRTSPGSGSSGA